MIREGIVGRLVRSSRRGADAPSIRGALLLLLTSMVATVLVSGIASALVLAYTIGWAVWLCPGALRRLCRPRMVILVLSLMVLGALSNSGGQGWTIAGMTVSGEGLHVGVTMAIRALTLVVATATFSRTISIGGLSALFQRLGVGQLGFLLGVAINLLPLVQSTAQNVLLAIRLRGGFCRHRVRAATRAAVTILVSSLRRSEDIVCAAEARAYTGEPVGFVAMPLSGTDRWVFLFSLFFYGGILLLQLLGQ